MKKEDTPQYYLECLKSDIEAKVGRRIVTYTDFNYLSMQLGTVISDAPSVSTLKRLWSYVSDSSSRSLSTLNSLSRFLGFTDWINYLEHLMRESRVESAFLDVKTIVSSTLHKGDRIEIGWHPGRRIQVEYMGDNRFHVLESENAKLKEGMEFVTMMFAKGSPFSCSEVIADGVNLGQYVAGSRNGVTLLQIIPKSADDAPLK